MYSFWFEPLAWSKFAVMFGYYCSTIVAFISIIQNDLSEGMICDWIYWQKSNYFYFIEQFSFVQIKTDRSVNTIITLLSTLDSFHAPSCLFHFHVYKYPSLKLTIPSQKYKPSPAPKTFRAQIDKAHSVKAKNLHC